MLKYDRDGIDIRIDLDLDHLRDRWGTCKDSGIIVSRS